jgi:adenylate cyclase
LVRRLARNLTIGRLAGSALIAIFVALRFWDPAPLENIRGMTFDLYQFAHPRVVSDYPVTIVDIDERALKSLGQWPWPRTIVAELVDRLAAGGAAAIGFDTIFAEPDRLSPRRIAESVKTLEPAARQTFEALPDNDQQLAEAIARTRVVLGQAGLPGSAGIAGRADALPHTSIVTIGGDPLSDLIQLPQLLTNLPVLEKAAAGRGLFTVQPDRDGVTRRIPTILAAENEIRPALSLELLRVASGATSLIVKHDEAGVKSIVVAGVEITTDRDGELWLHFGPHDPKRYVSAVDVLDGKVAAERINGKLILIGTSAVGLFDFRSTPVERVMPGVEIHAQAIESILSGALLVRPNYALGAEVCMAIVVGLGMVIAVPMLGALPALLLGGLVAALLISYSWYLFVAKNTLIDVVYPLLSSAAVFLLLTFLNYFREEKRRAQIRSAFSQYLAPELVEQLTREPDRLVLGGETRVMSVLFSDVRGFTAIAEGFKSNPSGLTALMNRLLTPLSNAIIERRGTIDKYIGDAIMAFWNAPLDDPDHALHACEAALEIVRRLDILNAERKREAQRAGETVSDMQIGVGISTGDSVVGNMGSEIRFDYSVLGDSVNLASRLEALTASYGLQIFLCAETARHGAGKLALLEIDSVRVRGKEDVVTIFTLLGGPDLLQQDHFRAFRGAFSEMREHYNRGEWRAARLSLERSRRNNENTRMTKVLDLYAKRLAALEAGPAIANWDGVYSYSATSQPS